MAEGEENNNENITNEELERLKELRQERENIIELVEKLEKGEMSYVRTLLKTKEAQAKLNQQRQRAEKLRAQGREKDAAALEKQIQDQQKQVDKLEEARKQMSFLKRGTEELGKGIDKVASSFKNQFLAEVKQAPSFLLDTTKEIKSAEIRMGKASSQSEEFTERLSKAGQEATKLGGNVGEMAQMQAEFNKNVGRSITLTEDSLVAMEELAHGTTLGVEGTNKLASQMELFGIHAEETRDIVEDLVQESGQIGVSTEKSTENLQQGAELAQKFRFKDGMDDVKKMAQHAAKFRMEMEAVAPMAEKVFNVEGAVEMAANLQVMGGEASKIADPFKLMFEARHDMEAFTKSITQMTKDMATFNKQTGEFELTGQQLHRVREIADKTGIATEQLVKMSKQAAKMEKAGAQIPIGFNPQDDEIKEFVKNKAFFEDGEAKMVIEGEAKALKEFGQKEVEQIKEMRKEQRKKDLKSRAKEAQTFDQAFENFMNQIKATLLPGFKTFTDSLTNQLQNLQDWWNQGGEETMKSWAQSAIEWGKSAGKLAKTMIQFVANNPWKSIGALVMGKMAQWTMRGMWLGQGFKQATAGMFGGRGGGGMMGPGGGRGFTGSGKQQHYMRLRQQGFGRETAKNKVKGVSGFLNRTGGNIRRGTAQAMRSPMGRTGAGVLGGIGGQMLSSKAQQLREQGAIGQKGEMGMHFAGGALQGAGVGFMLGGPYGAAIGAAGGGLAKAFMNRPTRGRVTGGDPVSGVDDFIVRPGEGVVPFNENDTIVGMKDGGPIQKSAEETTTRGGEMEIRFKDSIEVNGNITVSSERGDRLGNIDFDRNPQMAKQITRMVQEELEKNINNGKLQPNP